MKPEGFKPMLSGECTDVTALRYPVLASPKLDGVRAVVFDGVVYSRNMKPFPNLGVQVKFGRKEYEGLDGELIAGDPCAPDAFRKTQSVTSSVAGDAKELRFYAFDKVHALTKTVEFHKRLASAECAKGQGLITVPHMRICAADALAVYERDQLAKGYEGVMLRDPNGPYKFGRSTEKEGWLLKLKRFADAEGEVIGVKEQMHNGNPLEQDELGRAKRSSHKANKHGKGVLGALTLWVLNGPFKDAVLDVGTGFDDRQREVYWTQHKLCPLHGKIAKFKYFPTGSKDAPRFPVFLGFRDSSDM